MSSSNQFSAMTISVPVEALAPLWFSGHDHAIVAGHTVETAQIRVADERQVTPIAKREAARIDVDCRESAPSELVAQTRAIPRPDGPAARHVRVRDPGSGAIPREGLDKHHGQIRVRRMISQGLTVGSKGQRGLLACPADEQLRLAVGRGHDPDFGTLGFDLLAIGEPRSVRGPCRPCMAPVLLRVRERFGNAAPVRALTVDAPAPVTSAEMRLSAPSASDPYTIHSPSGEKTGTIGCSPSVPGT